MMALAEYFSKKKWPTSASRRRRPTSRPARSAPTARSAAPAAIRRSYLGEGTQPRLAGQRREYLLQSMLDFRTRKRGNNPGMSDLMRATSEDDLRRSRSIWRGCVGSFELLARQARCRAGELGPTSRRQLICAASLSRTASLAARSSADLPLLSAVAVGAAREQHLDDRRVPESAAIIRAVRPRLSAASMSAPRSSRSLTTPRRRGARRPPRSRRPTSAR